MASRSAVVGAVCALCLCCAPGARAAPPDAPRPGDVLEGGYRVERELGAGSTAVVFAGTELDSGKAVAIKWSLYDDQGSVEVVRRLEREYRAARRVEHPNIVHMHALGRDRGHVFLVMELLDGEPLSELIARGRMPLWQAVRTLLPAIDAIAACHDQGVVHRDIKPDNIFVLRDGTPEAPSIRVIDFGLSKLRPADVELKLTQPGTVLGTPIYMAPEQIRTPHAVDGRADVYAFGVVLYEMLSQQYPIVGDSYQDFLVRLATASPMPLRRYRPDLPRELRRAVMQAIAHDPKERFQDLPSLRAALEPFAAEGHGQSGVASRWLLAAAAVALLAVVALLGWWRRRTHAR